MKYYFAYGSNMNQEQMLKRCHDSKLVGRAVLENYKIAFTIRSSIRNCGCADVVKSEGYEVWGILYEINNKDLSLLDSFEKHPYKYKRFTTNVINENGDKLEAEVYEVVDKSEKFQAPSKHYLGLMLEASKEFNFSEDYQNILKTVQTSD